MRDMIKVSLLLNIVVQISLCIGLVYDASWIATAYGPATAPLGILLSIYIAIAIFSLLLLFVNEPKFVAGLLFIQVVYRLTTPLTVGNLLNPMVVSNLAIAAFHGVILSLILQRRRTRTVSKDGFV